MEEKILKIKEWLGSGSINIFGLPMSGKDTVGMRLAEVLGARFLSSGIIIRELESEQNSNLTGSGKLIPTNTFYDIILPYFSREDLAGLPLVLSSVGRWSGEEDEIMRSARAGGHPIKAVVILNLSEKDVWERWDAAKTIGDRGLRVDDMDETVFRTRIEEFREKTLPVLKHYNELGLTVTVSAEQPRDAVFEDVVKRLYEFSRLN